MPRDILSEYGPESANPQVARMSKNGPVSERDVRNYQPPTGPIGITRNPGPGLGGVNYGNCGTQGPKGTRQGESGSTGIGGDAPTSGTNRKG